MIASRNVSLAIVPATELNPWYDCDQFVAKIEISGLDLRAAMLAAHFSGKYAYGDFDPGEHGRGDAGDPIPLGAFWYAESLASRGRVSVSIGLEEPWVRFQVSATREGLEALDHTTEATELNLGDRLALATAIREFLSLPFEMYDAAEYDRLGREAQEQPLYKAFA